MHSLICEVDCCSSYSCKLLNCYNWHVTWSQTFCTLKLYYPFLGLLHLLHCTM